MEINSPNVNLIACCGLYCANCGKFGNNSCPGCKENIKAGWCKIRACCIQNNIQSCAECSDFQKPGDCKKYNNVFSRLIQFVTRTDRELCIDMIKEKGRESFVMYMTENSKMSLPKTKN